jgi:hypothetical protein
MAQTVTTFQARRHIHIRILLLLAGALLLLYLLFEFRLPRIAFASGWLLLGLIGLLAAYNGRKKIPFLPLARSEGWLQVHIYGGLLAALVFGMHLRFHFPTGIFESLLALLFVLVTLSGFVGLELTRMIPKRLTALGGEVIFERIPFERRALREKARALALGSVGKARSTTMAVYYADELDAYFARPRFITEHLLDLKIQVNRLLRRSTELNRFLSGEERADMEEIIKLIQAKYILDHHYSLQLVLKLWLFIHIPLTYGLLVFSALHVALVYAFSSAAG